MKKKGKIIKSFNPIKIGEINNGNSSIKIKKNSEDDENFKTQAFEKLKGTIKIGGLIEI